MNPPATWQVPESATGFVTEFRAARWPDERRIWTRRSSAASRTDAVLTRDRAGTAPTLFPIPGASTTTALRDWDAQTRANPGGHCAVLATFSALNLSSAGRSRYRTKKITGPAVRDV